MRKVERLLSLVTAPDRATAIVGDLVEQYSGMRLAWAVVRTGVALLARGAWSAPGRMALCLACGFLCRLLVYPLGVMSLRDHMWPFIAFDLVISPMSVAAILSWMNPGREIATIVLWRLAQVCGAMVGWHLSERGLFAIPASLFFFSMFEGLFELAAAASVRRYRTA